MVCYLRSSRPASPRNFHWRGAAFSTPITQGPIICHDQTRGDSGAGSLNSKRSVEYAPLGLSRTRASGKEYPNYRGADSLTAEVGHQGGDAAKSGESVRSWIRIKSGGVLSRDFYVASGIYRWRGRVTSNSNVKRYLSACRFSGRRARQLRRFYDPQTAGGMHGDSRADGAKISFETPRVMPVMLKTPSSRCSSHLDVLGVIERFPATPEPPEACTGSLGGFPNEFECSLTQPVHHQVLEVPKAPSEAPERDHGFLGVVEPILRDPRAAGGMRARPRVIDATEKRHAWSFTRVGSTRRSPPQSGASMLKYGRGDTEYTEDACADETQQVVQNAMPARERREQTMAEVTHGQTRRDVDAAWKDSTFRAPPPFTPHRSTTPGEGRLCPPLVYAAFIVERRIWPLQAAFDWNNSRNSKGMQKFACRDNYQSPIIAAFHATRRQAVSDEGRDATP
ncbi:hypothetical protein EV121DRAFT_272040 [Schizophyllum commune]